MCFHIYKTSHRVKCHNAKSKLFIAQRLMTGALPIEKRTTGTSISALERWKSHTESDYITGLRLAFGARMDQEATAQRRIIQWHPRTMV